jgi:hypothetical protein
MYKNFHIKKHPKYLHSIILSTFMRDVNFLTCNLPLNTIVSVSLQYLKNYNAPCQKLSTNMQTTQLHLFNSKQSKNIGSTFHCDSGEPTMVTFLSVCWSWGLSCSRGAIFTDAPEKRMMLRMCVPLVPMIAPTALFGMYRNVVSWNRAIFLYSDKLSS